MKILRFLGAIAADVVYFADEFLVGPLKDKLTGFDAVVKDAKAKNSIIRPGDEL